MIYVAGDVHLSGDEADDHPFHRWLARLAAMPPARLVILGDLVEYWLETDAAVARQHRLLSGLRRLRAAGWQLDLVRGNRELTAGRQLASAFSGRVHWPYLDLVTPRGVVRVVHGDRLIRDPGYRTFAAGINTFWFRVFQDLHPAWIQDAVARFLRRRSQAKQRQPRMRRPFIDPRRVAGSARGCVHLIAGHIHEQWTRPVRGIPLTLVGDWSGGLGRWVTVDDDGSVLQHRSG